jgi:hypothetical protein
MTSDRGNTWKKCEVGVLMFTPGAHTGLLDGGEGCDPRQNMGVRLAVRDQGINPPT